MRAVNTSFRVPAEARGRSASGQPATLYRAVSGRAGSKPADVVGIRGGVRSGSVGMNCCPRVVRVRSQRPTRLRLRRISARQQRTSSARLRTVLWISAWTRASWVTVSTASNSSRLTTCQGSRTSALKKQLPGLGTSESELTDKARARLVRRFDQSDTNSGTWLHASEPCHQMHHQGCHRDSPRKNGQRRESG